MASKTYPENVMAFLSEIKDSIGEPEEVDGLLYIPVRNEIVSDFDTFSSLRKRTLLFAEKLALEQKIKLSFINPIDRVSFQIELSPSTKPATAISNCNSSIDLEKEHIERLKIAFGKVSADQISESVKFLSDHGWTDAQIMKTYNISSVTLWRYKNRKAAGQQANEADNSQSTEKEHLDT